MTRWLELLRNFPGDIEKTACSSAKVCEARVVGLAPVIAIVDLLHHYGDFENGEGLVVVNHRNISTGTVSIAMNQVLALHPSGKGRDRTDRFPPSFGIILFRPIAQQD